MSVSLSHTAKELYLRSPKAYFLHYLLKIRPETTGSALFFGSIIESGLEVLFKTANLEEAKETFRKNFVIQEVNGKVEDLATSTAIKYSKKDYDPDILTDLELEEMVEKPQQYKSWFSLRRKGEMLIEAYYNEILPNIKRVIGTQVKFTIDNSKGDEIVGIADMICEWNDGRILVLDHKTSSVKYPSDAVQTEQYGKQTALYYEIFKDEYKIDGAGFIVLEKDIRKREPRTRVYVTKFEVPNEELIEKTFAEFENVGYNIKQAQFPCCSPNCDVYGQSCPYKNYCGSNGEDMTGLVKVNGYKK